MQKLIDSFSCANQPWTAIPVQPPVARCIVTWLLFAVCSVTSLYSHGQANPASGGIDLPELGDSTAGLMTPSQERELGQAWLRAFRAAVPLNEDPLLYEYLENFLFKLASYSQLEERELDLVVIDNPTINAFAVPGGVVGLHTGLLVHAENEAQLGSVLAHEIGHLSQRHFARGVEASKQASLMSIAGLLAGIVLAATTGGDAATAAVIGSQAAALDSQLRYSRMHEREADREGIKTLSSAGYSPDAVAEMFQQMLDASRYYGRDIPEFLLTHPVTQSRVTEAKNRARQLPARDKNNSLEYMLMKARVTVMNVLTPTEGVAEYQKILKATESDKSSAHHHTARYGLALALYRNRQLEEAKTVLQPLLKLVPGKIAYSLLDIEIDIANNKLATAERRLRDLNTLIPNNYAIGMLLAETLVANAEYSSAQRVLEQLAADRPKQADIWYLLAETHGLAGDILALHKARAEFFILRANFQQAKKQLGYALKISKDEYLETAKIKQRLIDIHEMQERQKKL